MTYAMQGFGVASASPACGTNAQRNPKTQECFCNVGYTWANENDPNNHNCVQRTMSAPCTWDGQQYSPVDRACSCPPGMYPDPSPTGTGCIRVSWFPNCVDANGQRVPGCLFGYATRDVAVLGGIGVIAGLLVGKALFG